MDGSKVKPDGIAASDALSKPVIPREPVRAAAVALQSGDLDAAAAFCAKGLQTAPDDPALNELAARTALRAGRNAEAATSARHSLRSRPHHVPTLLLLGRAAQACGEHAAAVLAFREAADHAPDRSEPAFSLCASLLRVADPGARMVYDHLLSQFPAEADGWDELGLALLELGQRKAALLCLDRAAAATPTFARAMRRGLILRDYGRLTEARAAFDAALVLDATAVRAWFLLGVCAQDLGDLGAAAAAYRRALMLDPGLAEAAVNLGTVLQGMGDLDAAKAAYAQAVRTRPDSFGRVAQALTMASRGELWLDLDALRGSLGG